MTWPAVSPGGDGDSTASHDGIDVGPIPYCVDPDWAPYEKINEQGVHEGIAADLLNLATIRAGVRLHLVKTATWEESLEAARAGRCSFLSFLNETPNRKDWLVFTDPIFIDANVIITREEHPFVSDLAAVGTETIVLPQGTSIAERVRHDFPDLRIVETTSESEAFALVSARKADLTIRSLTVAVYTIKKDGWFNLKISGQIPGYENRLRLGIRKEDAALRDILNRGVTTITPQEMREAANRHASVNVTMAVDYGPIRNLAVAFSLIMLTSAFWGMKLIRANERLRVQSRTDSLTGLANRTRLNERLVIECERAGSYGTVFVVILLDLDHFKNVNDDFGHLMGDRILVAFADVLRLTCRSSDTVGRWGGEEFLILCPGIEGADAVAVAERVCRAVSLHPFETGRIHTVSAGVTMWEAGDTPDTLVRRADDALYQAKEAGRNCVRVR